MCCPKKKILNETKNIPPPPLQVKWSVPTYLFADDTNIFREIREENDEKMLQADLDSLQSWSDTWLLKFHPNKCKVMSVANKCVDKGTKHYYLYNNDGNRIEKKT